ncbi:sugar O-acetyltransferase [Glaciecola sp. 1036]|uniref:sugar O-acetyltransferase n=1 Tax=Alteromonadaceae TaxID=72275 RepID=UPI003D02D16B
MRAFDAMLNGDKYWINDPELVEIRYQTRDLVDEFNALGAREVSRKQDMMKQILGKCGDDIHIEKPVRFDYGKNLFIGSHVFINFNLTVVNPATVTIGNHVFIGPNVGLYTAHHPLDAEERDKHIGFAEPIVIGNHVWIGGDTTILPGVTIGDGCVIGAGSVVTKDVPPGMLALGQPCRPIRQIEAKI